jgi:hypothetical protein
MRISPRARLYPVGLAPKLRAHHRIIDLLWFFSGVAFASETLHFQSHSEDRRDLVPGSLPANLDPAEISPHLDYTGFSLMPAAQFEHYKLIKAISAFSRRQDSAAAGIA